MDDGLDLYADVARCVIIMAEMISFKLEVFEGPLDVLLSLIAKHKLNIYDIEISVLLEQYLDYLEKYREKDLDLAGEFLEMAARLIYIKTVSLLPKPEEAVKEKEALQGVLIEYAICKATAKLLREKYRGDKVFVRGQMEIKAPTKYDRTYEASKLVHAWEKMGQRKIEKKENLEARMGKVIQRPTVSVMSKTVYLMRRVYHNEHVYLGELYADVRERSARVALFLAILELTRHGRLGISEDGTYVYATRQKPWERGKKAVL